MSKSKPTTQVEFWVNAGEKAITLTPVDQGQDIDVRVNVNAGVAPWFATRVLGKSEPTAKAPRYIRWSVDINTFPEHVSASTGNVFRVLDLRDPETFKSWVREVKALVRTRGTANPATAAMLAELDNEFGIGDENVSDDPFS